jgi:hypothetical protein
MSDSQDLVCVYNATNPSMAELVRNLLEDEGIQAAVGDNHNPFPGLSIMPSEVFVERSNERQAREIIAAAEQAHKDAAEEMDDGGDDEDILIE